MQRKRPLGVTCRHVHANLYSKMQSAPYVQVTCVDKVTECNMLAHHSATVQKENRCYARTSSDAHTTATTTTTTTTTTSASGHRHASIWISVLALLTFFMCCGLSDAALRNVNLFIVPPVVRHRQSVTLRCQYDLEEKLLYSVKFYRGQLEFFRFTPGEYPNTKVLAPSYLKVDESASNATQVVIRNVDFSLTGNFSCEVTADAPSYSTAVAFAQMQVVEFPDKRPQLYTEHTRYEPGDILRANCSTPPARPRAELLFTINNIPVSSGETQYIRTVDNLIASRRSLKLQLQGAHFATTTANSHLINTLGGNAAGITYSTLPAQSTSSGGSSHGSLILRCTAQIGDLYQEYKEIELGSPQKDPVPARVTLSSSSGLRNFFETYFSSSTSSAVSVIPGMGRAWFLLTVSIATIILYCFTVCPLYILS